MPLLLEKKKIIENKKRLLQTVQGSYRDWKAEIFLKPDDDMTSMEWGNELRTIREES